MVERAFHDPVKSRILKVVVYNRSTGQATLEEVWHVNGEAEVTRLTTVPAVDLGYQATLPGAVQQAVNLGHQPQGWIDPKLTILMDISAIRVVHPTQTT